jgi:UDP-3-O-[3-hydroxymyristoyl] glucosamine N-acyltransferase
VLGVGVVVLEGASIGSGARIGSGALVACGARIGRDVVIGADCRIGENAVIGDRVLLGDRVVVHQGAVIGSRGFGFAKQPDGSWRALPQLGTVRIGDDVEIGANTTIDRATAGETLIGAGTKIDNLVQIAHNVIVGRDVLIAAQCGIAGSARIGDRCVLAGQVGIADHCIVEDDVVIGATSGVTTTRLLAGRHYFGSPARELGEMKRMLAALRRLVKKTEGD